MTCNEFQPRLSEFVDDALSPEERKTLAAHLDGCVACRGLVRDLERLRSTASHLGPMQPPDHIWLEIAGQIRLGDKGPTAAFRPAAAALARQPIWQWVGLAAALVVVTLGVFLFTRLQQPRTPPEPGNGNDALAVQLVEQELRQAEMHYENAIARLEAIAKTGDGTLDPAVASTLEKNLATINQAIAESRAALSDNPDNAPARESLFEALRRKVSVLEATVSLMNEMRKGDSAGAARVIGRKG